MEELSTSFQQAGKNFAYQLYKIIQEHHIRSEDIDFEMHRNALDIENARRFLKRHGELPGSAKPHYTDMKRWLEDFSTKTCLEKPEVCLDSCFRKSHSRGRTTMLPPVLEYLPGLYPSRDYVEGANGFDDGARAMLLVSLFRLGGSWHLGIQGMKKLTQTVGYFSGKGDREEGRRQVDLEAKRVPALQKLRDDIAELSGLWSIAREAWKNEQQSKHHRAPRELPAGEKLILSAPPQTEKKPAQIPPAAPPEPAYPPFVEVVFQKHGITGEARRKIESYLRTHNLTRAGLTPEAMRHVVKNESEPGRSSAIIETLLAGSIAALTRDEMRIDVAPRIFKNETIRKAERVLNLLARDPDLLSSLFDSCTKIFTPGVILLSAAMQDEKEFKAYMTLLAASTRQGSEGTAAMQEANRIREDCIARLHNVTCERMA